LVQAELADLKEQAHLHQQQEVFKVDQVQYFLPHQLVVDLVGFGVHLVQEQMEDLEVQVAAAVLAEELADQQQDLLVEGLILFLLLLDLETLVEQIQDHRHNRKAAAEEEVQEQ
jgi:hypothetical protein